MRGCSLKRSHVCAEMVTGPNGDPPVGGSKMPLTTNRFWSPFANVSSTGEPTARSWSSAKPSVTNEPSSPSCASTASEPSFQSIEKIRLVGGSTAVALNVSPNARASPARTLPTNSTPCAVARRLTHADRKRREVVLGRHRVVGVLPELVDGVPEGRDDAGGEHRDERDERQADHQRRRRRGGSLRIAPGVVARERSGHAAESCPRPPQPGRERPDETLREQRDAEEDQERP